MFNDLLIKCLFTFSFSDEYGNIPISSDNTWYERSRFCDLAILTERRNPIFHEGLLGIDGRRIPRRLNGPVEDASRGWHTARLLLARRQTGGSPTEEARAGIRGRASRVGAAVVRVYPGDATAAATSGSRRWWRLRRHLRSDATGCLWHSTSATTARSRPTRSAACVASSHGTRKRQQLSKSHMRNHVNTLPW